MSPYLTRINNSKCTIMIYKLRFQRKYRTQSNLQLYVPHRDCEKEAKDTDSSFEWIVY